MKRFIYPIIIVLVVLLLSVTQVVAAPEANKGGVKPTPNEKHNDQGEKNTGQGAKPEKPTKPEKPSESEKPVKLEKVNVKGMIVDLSEASITIENQKDGALMTFVVTSETQVKIPRLKDTKITDLKVGQDVTIKGTKAEDGALTALKITLIPGKYEKYSRVGEVTDYQPGVSITITDKNNELFTFKVTEDTIILPKDRANELAVGRRVTIIMPRDVTGGEPTAKKIVVHPLMEEGETETVTTDG